MYEELKVLYISLEQQSGMWRCHGLYRNWIAKFGVPALHKKWVQNLTPEPKNVVSPDKIFLPKLYVSFGIT